MGSTFRPDNAKIKSLRIRKGWPQEQLARIADVSPRTIQRVEAGGNASFETLRSIADAFELEVHELMLSRESHPGPVTERAGAPLQSVEVDLPPVERFLPYLPIVRMTLGSLTLVLLASVAIRLSPHFLAYLDPETSWAESHEVPRLNSPVVDPGPEVRQPVTATVRDAGIRPRDGSSDNGAASPGEKALLVQAGNPSRIEPGVPDTDHGSRMDQPGFRASSGWFLDTPMPETIGANRPDDLLDLNPIVMSRAIEPSSGIHDSMGLQAVATQSGEGLAEIVSRRVVGNSTSVGRTLARTGKGSAAFFANAGSSIKKAF